MEQSPQKKKRQPSDYGRYSTMAFQMAATVGLGVWGGIKLDEYFHFETPAFTIGLSFFSVVVGLWLLVKDFLKKK